MVVNFYERDGNMYTAEQILEMDENENSKVIEVENEESVSPLTPLPEVEGKNIETSENEVVIEKSKTKKTTKK